MSKELNIPELNIPVKYNGKIVGWTNSENPSTIKFVDEESRKLIEKHIEHPITYHLGKWVKQMKMEK